MDNFKIVSYLLILLLGLASEQVFVSGKLMKLQQKKELPL